MTFKRQREQQNVARAASKEVFKKRRLKARSLSNSAQPKIDDDKLSTVDTSDTEGNLEEGESRALVLKFVKLR